MIDLSPVQELFQDESAVPRESMKKAVVYDLQSKGISENQTDISFQSDHADDILTQEVDPEAASGYLTFKGENDYNNWLTSQMFSTTGED